MTTRRWTINGRFLSQPITGVQRYAEEITRALDALKADGAEGAQDLELEIVCPPTARPLLGLRATPIRIVGSGGGHAWEQTVLPRAVRGGLLSLGNSGPIAKRRQIVCIHDMNTRLTPQSYSAPFRLFYRALLPALGARAARIATVSRFSAAQIARFGVAPAEKIVVIPNGADHTRRWAPEMTPVVAPACDGAAVVMLGSVAPHKNLGIVLGLAGDLSAHGVHVVVAGGGDARVFQTSGAAAVDGAVTYLGRVSNGELAALLSNALCLAFPSLTEGFGLPPVEAMAMGCPVVSSNGGSLPEVCGDAALYAAPHDAKAWLAAILSLKRDAGLRAALIERGRAQAQRYVWAASARRYLDEMSVIDNGDARRVHAC
ncbi:MAG: glycosyltransferase family 1 protein [Hyphomicrobiales bacterium]|nr:glycosyltransferase family 1 protein [Hyphomicrobiales bacterium]